MRTKTSSYRISNELHARLSEAARQLKRGRNSIVMEALQEYLDRMSRQRFLEEARRQSILAGEASNADDHIWLEHADTTGWK